MTTSSRNRSVTEKASSIQKTASKIIALTLVCLSAVLWLGACSDGSLPPKEGAELCLNEFCEAVKAEDWTKATGTIDLATADPLLLSVWNCEAFTKAEELLSKGNNVKKALDVLAGVPDISEEFLAMRESLATIPAASRKKLTDQLPKICRSLREVDAFQLKGIALRVSGKGREFLEVTPDLVRMKFFAMREPMEAVFRRNGKEWRLSSLDSVQKAGREEPSEVELVYAKTTAKKKYDAGSPEQALADCWTAESKLDVDEVQTFLADDYVKSDFDMDQWTKDEYIKQGQRLKGDSVYEFYRTEIEHADDGTDWTAFSDYLKSLAGSEVEEFVMEQYRKRNRSEGRMMLQTMSVVPDSRKVEGDDAELDVVFYDALLGRAKKHVELVRKDGKWLIRKEVTTLMPPATDEEKKSMGKTLRLMGVAFDDEDENRFAGIYDNIDKAPLTRKGVKEKEYRALWEILKTEDRFVSYDATRFLYDQDNLFPDEVKQLKFNEDSHLDQLAARLRDFYFVNDPNAVFPEADEAEQAEKWGTLSRVIVGKAVLGRFVWGRYQKHKASYLDQVLASWLEKAKVTDDNADLIIDLWSSYPPDPRIYDRMKMIDTLAKNGAPEWVTSFLRGWTSIQLAWEARGNGTASTVTDDGWNKFRLYLKDADRYLDRSIKLNPDNYFAYCEKITTAMGHGTAAQELENFKKGIAIAPEDGSHLGYLLNALMPRWGGSRREMKQILLEGMKLDENKSRVPLVSFNDINLDMFNKEFVPLTFRSFYMDPVVQDCGERLFAQALKRSKDAYYQNVIRLEQALFYLNSLRYEDALKAFDKITFKGKELDKFLYDNSVLKFQTNYPVVPIYEDPKAAFELRRSAVAPILRRIELNFVTEKIPPAVARRQLLALAETDEAKSDPAIRNSLIDLAAAWGEPEQAGANYKTAQNHSGPAWECACFIANADRIRFFFDHDYDVGAVPHFFLRARYHAGVTLDASNRTELEQIRRMITAEAKKHWKYVAGDSDPERTIEVEYDSPRIDYSMVFNAAKSSNRDLLVIEYESIHEFIFNLNGDTLTIEPFQYAPLPSAVTVNGKPWTNLSKPFRLPFKPDLSHGFSMLFRGVSKWSSQAFCDGDKRAELLICPAYEFDRAKMAFAVLFGSNALPPAPQPQKPAQQVIGGLNPKRVNSVPFDPETMSGESAEKRKKSIVFEGKIDGTGLFTFSGKNVTYKHSRFDYPDYIRINGVTWDNLNVPFKLDFTPDYSKTKVVEMDGRGEIRVNYTQDKLELYINDSEASRDEYRVSVYFEGN
ncbi:MAG: hypothetical protein IJT68_06025 [Lentisphaeria bacterium]|nr:hypothetical protein [Lentisphaeria bacterium]